MTFYVDPIEAAWIVMNTSAVVITAASFVEAFRRWQEARRLNGKHRARRLVARSNTRREALRGIVQALLLSLVVPGLVIDIETTLNPFSAVLIAISAVLLVQTALDTRDRYQLNDLLEDGAPVSAVALESTVQEVKVLTQVAADKAADAYEVGNHSKEALISLNEKNNDMKQDLIRLTELVAGKEDKA